MQSKELKLFANIALKVHEDFNRIIFNGMEVILLREG